MRRRQRGYASVAAGVLLRQEGEQCHIVAPFWPLREII